MQYGINEIPLFNKLLIDQLLGLEPTQQYTKNKNELVREYEYEKWGKILQLVNDGKVRPTIQAVDSLGVNGTGEVLYYELGKFYKLQIDEAKKRYKKNVINFLKKFKSTDNFVELGAGYGGIIIELAKLMPQKNYFACDLMPSGRKLLDIISSYENIELKIGKCDFFNKIDPVELDIPKNSIIFTNISLSCVSKIEDFFIQKLIDLKPSFVVHFEPCYEHANQSTLHSLLVKKYIQLNDYNKNLITLLKQFECQKKIEIINEKPTLYGVNALFPSSLIAWKPL